ncbi:hypothetical protein PG996_000142 [Apiospora saccharicola]|uniref:Uncharacterized protein n=1 Tax=Apiospora saccharicola TaxID=335842 RepID=A0ABR1WCW2_9PEZI
MPIGRIGSIAFVHSPYSQGSGAAGLSASQARARVHSHAAREAHAKVRRQRLVEFQAAKKISGDEERVPITVGVEAAPPS